MNKNQSIKFNYIYLDDTLTVLKTFQIDNVFVIPYIEIEDLEELEKFKKVPAI